MGYLWLNGWDIYHLMVGQYDLIEGHLYHIMGRALMTKLLGNMLKKWLFFRGVPFLIIAWPQVSVPLNFRPVDYYREGGTTPHLRLVLRSPALGWLSKFMNIQ